MEDPVVIVSVIKVVMVAFSNIVSPETINLLAERDDTLTVVPPLPIVNTFAASSLLALCCNINRCNSLEVTVIVVLTAAFILSVTAIGRKS